MENLDKLGCPPKFVNLVRHLHEGMNAKVISEGEKSESFAVGVKQCCMLAPTLLALLLAAMLNEVNCGADSRGVSIQYRMDGGLFNLHRFLTKYKTVTTKLTDQIFADDCALRWRFCR